MKSKFAPDARLHPERRSFPPRAALRRIAACFCFAASFPLAFGTPASAQQEDLSFTLPPDSPVRIFSQTNRKDAFFCGCANGFNSSGFHGVTRNKEKLFETYWIVAGAKLLDPREALVTVTPSRVVRFYPSANIREEISFADSLTLLSVHLTGDYRGALSLIPAWSSRYEGEQGAATERWDYGEISETCYDILRPSHCAVVIVHPRVRAVDVPPALRAQLKNPAPAWCPVQFATDAFAGEMLFTVEFFDPGSAPLHRSKRFVSDCLARKEERIASAIDRFAFRSSDSLLNRAVRWIAASLDALTMKSHLPSGEEYPALYAGLPWFDDYWGRDTFISLPGALLVTGDFDTAKRIFRLFAKYQERNPRNPNYGRIPNRITPSEAIYNTADGTPWFVRELYEYVRYSGDRELARELYPAVETAVDGTLKFHLDATGFLAHGDAESWMDAVGDKGAWSPRADFAVEIEALWIDQLRISALFAEWSGREDKAREWRSRADRTAGEFRKRFVDARGVLLDRLRKGMETGQQERPNSLIALSAPAFPLVSDSVAFATLKHAAESCVYPYGVASLSQFDPAFHPYHEYPGFYPKDAAYHNGTVWTWLTGPAVSLLCRFGYADKAFEMTRALQKVSAEQGQIGSLPELLNAIPRGDESIPAWSGTFSQTWTLAEFLRNLSQDYLGLQPDALSKRLIIRPRLPASLSSMEADCRIGAGLYHVAEELSDPRAQKFTIRRISGSDPLSVSLDLLYKNVLFSSDPVPVGPDEKEIVIFFRTEEHRFEVAGKEFRSTAAPFFVKPDFLRGLSFCAPYLNPGLASVKKPDHPVLDGMTVCSKNPAAVAIFRKEDPAGDDTGPAGKYIYPRNPWFRRGIFDIRSLTVSTDKEMVYFTITMEDLVQPGWHPEYGFQLTMLALAIDIDGVKRSGSRYVRANSKWILPDDMWYERLILIGGGIQVQDKNGVVLAEYTPVSEQYAIGDVARKTISFAIPARYLGEPGPHWEYLLLAGGQDDHGGGGIGEFRDVLPEAAEWNGGGNDRNGPNIYDTLSSR